MPDSAPQANVRIGRRTFRPNSVKKFMAVVLLRAIAILDGGTNAIEFQTDAAALYPVRFRRLDHAGADQAAGR